MPEDQRRRRGGVETSVRTSAIWDMVRDAATRHASDLDRPLRVVDLGGGSGGLAVPLAGLGHEVVVVDPSPDALASLSRRATEEGVAERITAVQGDAAGLGDVCAPGSADLVCCHGVLEFVDDPAATADAISAALDHKGILSLVTAGRLAAVLSRAVAGRFAQARHALTSDDGRWGAGDPLPRRFDTDEVRRLVTEAGLHIDTVHGVRLFADLVPSALLDGDADRAALLDLENAIATHPTYAFLGHLGAAVHVVAHKA